MKSHPRAGNIKLNGKKARLLVCGCCVVMNLKDAYAKQRAGKDLKERLEDDYTHEEFMADICSPESPCDLCLASDSKEDEPPYSGAPLPLYGTPKQKGWQCKDVKTETILSLFASKLSIYGKELYGKNLTSKEIRALLPSLPKRLLNAKVKQCVRKGYLLNRDEKYCLSAYGHTFMFNLSTYPT